MAEKSALYLSVSRYLAWRVLIEDSIFLCLQLEMGPPFLCSHLSHVKVYLLAVQRGYLFFLSFFWRPWVKVWPQESNLWPSALQSSALPTELILPWSKNNVNTTPSWQFTPFGCYRGTYFWGWAFCNEMGMTCRKAPPPLTPRWELICNLQYFQQNVTKISSFTCEEIDLVRI